jgi:NAD(P)H-nitrite reductase large subunit
MRYVIIGGGAAGAAAAQTLRCLDKEGQVTLIAEEERPGYYRPLIPHLIHDRLPEERFLRAPSLFSDLGVEVESPAKAESVDRERKVVNTSQRPIPYDRLLLAMGSQAIMPAIKGLSPEEALTLRSYDDGLKMAQAARPGMKAVVIGGGRVGIKAALALQEAGLEVTIVEMQSHILPQQFDETAASIIASAVEARGIRLQMGRQVSEVRHNPVHSKVVVLDDDQELPFDLLAVAVGVRPNVGLAQEMGVRVDKGVVVDSNLQTSVADVFAAGDLVQLVDLATGEEFVSGTWTNAVDMGNCAASNMAGLLRKYPGSFSVYNAVEVAGIPTVAIGAVHGQEPQFEVHSQRGQGTYHKFVFRGNRLVGMLLIGDIDTAGVYRTIIREGSDVSRIKEKIISRTLSYATFLKQLTPETKHYVPA